MSQQTENIGVYLAGGFSSGWQKSVIDALPSFKIFDPSTHNLNDPHCYTEWDLAAIRQSDYVLAYMERDNPGGYALALEIGYAKALGRYVILVEEHPTQRRRKSFEMIREVADFKFEALGEALKFLETETRIDRQKCG